MTDTERWIREGAQEIDRSIASLKRAIKDTATEKEMIDKLRCRNGNLEISVSPQQTAVSEL